MSKITFVFLMFLSTYNYAQWSQQSSGVTANLSDVFCINADMVFAAGESGTILKTTDGGLTWTQKSSGTTAHIKKIQFTDANNGYAVGHNGLLIHTNDGGETWATLDSGTTADLYGLSVLEPLTFFIAGDDGNIKMTADGGMSFTPRNVPDGQNVGDIQFLNDLTGYAKTEQLLKTVDGGMNWTAVAEYISAFYFAGEQIGYIASQEGYIMKTINGGSSFLPMHNSNPYIADLVATEAQNVWTVENVGTLCGCPSFCISKIVPDGNEGFDSASNCGLGGNLGLPFEAVHFANEMTGYAVGESGQIFKNPTGMVLATPNVRKTSAIKIYPNPATDLLSIEWEMQPSGSYTVQLLDIAGKCVISELYMARDTARVNISALVSGLYFVKVSADGHETTQKVIIE